MLCPHCGKPTDGPQRTMARVRATQTRYFEIAPALAVHFLKGECLDATDEQACEWTAKGWVERMDKPALAA